MKRINSEDMGVTRGSYGEGFPEGPVHGLKQLRLWKLPFLQVLVWSGHLLSLCLLPLQSGHLLAVTQPPSRFHVRDPQMWTPCRESWFDIMWPSYWWHCSFKLFSSLIHLHFVPTWSLYPIWRLTSLVVWKTAVSFSDCVLFYSRWQELTDLCRVVWAIPWDNDETVLAFDSFRTYKLGLWNLRTSHMCAILAQGCANLCIIPVVVCVLPKWGLSPVI